jgi:hypothetical protein
MSQPRLILAGDHIKVHRDAKFYPNGYHHGIYADGGRVIHLTGASAKEAKVQISPLYMFLNGGEIEIEYHDDANPGVTLYRAVLSLEQGGYNIVTNNCEHFALYCVSGQKSSWQVRDAVSRALGRGTFGVWTPLIGPTVEVLRASTWLLNPKGGEYPAPPPEDLRPTAYYYFDRDQNGYCYSHVDPAQQWFIKRPSSPDQWEQIEPPTVDVGWLSSHHLDSQNQLYFENWDGLYIVGPDGKTKYS